MRSSPFAFARLLRGRDRPAASGNQVSRPRARHREARQASAGRNRSPPRDGPRSRDNDDQAKVPRALVESRSGEKPARDLASLWMLFGSDACATLQLDGHVNACTGRKGRLPNHFVSRMMLRLLASAAAGSMRSAAYPWSASIKFRRGTDPHSRG